MCDPEDACECCPINERKKNQAAAASRSAQKRILSQKNNYREREKLNAYQVSTISPRNLQQALRDNPQTKQPQVFVKASVPEIKAANPLWTQQQIMAKVAERWRAQKAMVKERKKAYRTSKKREGLCSTLPQAGDCAGN